jgi:hypothetical protein
MINFYWKQLEYMYTYNTKAVEKEYKWKSIVIEIISNLKTIEIDGGLEYEYKILLERIWSIVTETIVWIWTVNRKLQLVSWLS